MTRKVSDRRIGEPKVVASIETATWRSSGANDRFVTRQSLDETPSCQSWPASHVRAAPVLEVGHGHVRGVEDVRVGRDGRCLRRGEVAAVRANGERVRGPARDRLQRAVGQRDPVDPASGAGERVRSRRTSRPAASRSRGTGRRRWRTARRRPAWLGGMTERVRSTRPVAADRMTTSPMAPFPGQAIDTRCPARGHAGGRRGPAPVFTVSWFGPGHTSTGDEHRGRRGER